MIPLRKENEIIKKKKEIRRQNFGYEGSNLKEIIFQENKDMKRH